MQVRVITPQDDIVALTAILHRAYAPLAARGLRYMATHQSPADTHRRLFKGHPLAAEKAGQIIGTITIYPPQPRASVATYRDPHTFSFGQFAVDPVFAGQGIGRILHQAAVDYALGQGARFLSLDTAAPATDLIATYARWGYAIVEHTHWGDTNYESVLMRRTLRPDPLGQAPACSA
jgi:GNAT superfamily N-acetyltransferase